MASVVQDNFRIRSSFGKIESQIRLPNLIEIQKRSYDKFLQLGIDPMEREDIGLQAVFRRVFPIKDFNESASLDFVKYEIDAPKYDVDECHSRGMTFAAPMKVSIRLIVWEKDEVTGQQSIRSVKEQDVYFGEIPLMTDHGTFIVNGTERVIVSQLHRSPGAFFFVNEDKSKTSGSGKLLHSARIIPNRGSWLDFEFDSKDILHVRIDRRRKMPATALLKALGYSTQELLDYFYETETVVLHDAENLEKKVDTGLLLGQRATRDIYDASGENVIVRKNRKFTRAAIRKLDELGIDSFPIDREELIESVLAEDIIDEETGEVIAGLNESLTEEKIETIIGTGVKEFKILFIDGLNVGSYLRDTLLLDKVESEDEAILEIYRRLRPGDPPTIDTARSLFNNLFFNPERYDLSKVGRLKLNHKFNLEEPIENTVLTKQDILEVVRYVLELKNGRGTVDDIDHLGNRRVRSVGELLENQFRVGLVRMERAIRERMSLQEIETLMPHDLINAKPVSAVIKEFFGSSQLSQFMDQTNPLSEVTHKRRLSALGPGGLTRERAGFEVRDVHTTHYGRICPIETPEGPNIGLIASLATFARVNEYGFVESPYRRVIDGQVTEGVEFFSALQEEQHTIAQANAQIAEDGQFKEPLVASRKSGDPIMARADEITLMDVSPKQLVSVATSLIPFLENDDANRALMGSNMQRQAVPLLRTEAPFVGTGMERPVARDSGVTIVAKRDGMVDSVDATRIVVKADTESTADIDVAAEVDIYNLTKFQRSNQNTCINQKPIVRRGDMVKAGDVIADGPATDHGELALGRNLVVAFMPWQGYNFEDSILISERVVKEDLYTSIHIEEFECVARDTKLGKEEITRDIPNVGEEALKDLDEAGIVRIGAEVTSSDILVGKITPKGETQLSPEEKLLRAIFGEKAGDVRDTSLRVPPGVVGTVIGAQVFARKGIDKDERAQQIEEEEETRLLKDQNDEIKIVKESARRKIAALLRGKALEQRLVDDHGEVLLEKGAAVTVEALEDIRDRYLMELRVGDSEAESKIESILDAVEERVALIKMRFGDKIARLKKGDELAPGVIKMVKVYVAIKRKLQVGDKMAGRHGNKGVISRILPEEDMPYTADGTPVDIALNPLGVPSRMNVGQILETHLGWGAKELGKKLDRLIFENFDADHVKQELLSIYKDPDHQKTVNKLTRDDILKLGQKLKGGVHFATPVFEGASEAEIQRILDQAGLPTRGQTVLFDGRTGEPFDQDVTVGVMYMLKLHHLVDDKIHARSIGPYSLVTQQPLGGKAQFGGQRLGEMEVWAMQAYGAAYALQEFLTVKSDDVQGRTRMYEAIVKGENVLESGIPESFKVLMKELQALCLDVELIEEEQSTGT
ncbi:MAG: DNA-directed RNA polymerase subunit beta [Myxococcota bacterium]